MKKSAPSPLVWTSQYEVGNSDIDAEHQMLVKIIGKIQQAVLDNASLTMLDRLLLELLKYVEFHFFSEENRMLEVGYPGLHRHRQAHKELLAALRGMLPEAGNELRDMDAFLRFLIEWFTTHAGTEDRTFTDYLRQGIVRGA